MEGKPKKIDFSDWFEFIPVEGRPNVSIMRARECPSSDGEMTEADWDKFEQDINDAFEQVP